MKIENVFKKFNQNTWIVLFITLGHAIELLFTILKDLTLGDWFNFQTISKFIILALLMKLFMNLFKMGAEIDDLYLMEIFNRFRSITNHSSTQHGLSMYIQDQILDMRFVLEKMKMDKKIKKRMTEKRLRDFIQNEYNKLYNEAGFAPFKDRMRPTITF